MDFISLIITALLTLLTGAFVVLLVLAIMFNLKAGQRYRANLAKRLDQLRLGKMLSALGIDTEAYLHSERILDIHQQMDRCSSCANTDRCDDQLADGTVRSDEIDFCNNERSLQELLKTNRSETP
jgi:hypothetical protein